MASNHQKQTFNKYGQFMTEDKLVESVLHIINKLSPIKGNVLEPSFGKGAFISAIINNYPVDKLDGYEIDPEMFNQVKINNDNVNLFLADFILTAINDEYNHIVGNPPFVEINYSYYENNIMEELKAEYKNISEGRLNLVHMFIHKSHQLLKTNGYLSFLLPSVILTSPYYKKLRKFLHDNFNIECVKNNVNFSGVTIKVSLLILKKTQNKSDEYFVNYNNNYYITEYYKDYPKNQQTLKNMGFNVTVGNICWNHHKEELTDNDKCTPIIYAQNIINNEIILNIEPSPNNEKKQYINNNAIKKFENFIAFPRTVSKKIKKIIIVKNNDRYHVENHLLIITHSDIVKLEELYHMFVNGEMDKYINLFNNSSTLSSKEILSIPMNPIK